MGTPDSIHGTKPSIFILLVCWFWLGSAWGQAQGGVGMHLDYDPPGSGNIVVYSVSYKSPADKAQIKRGDQLIKVEGQEVTGKPLQQVAALIGGPVGSTVNLTLLREGAPMEVAVIRAELKSKAPVSLTPPSQGGPGPGAVASSDPYSFNDLEKHLVKQKIIGLATPEQRDKMLQLLTALKDRKITASQFMEMMKKEFP
jgi:membrane-associated protease RseP (regulator of RpoE activity)